MSVFDTDFHSHILPGIDDGASCIEVSLEMLRIQVSQGLKTVIATPHFRYHTMNMEDFLNKRNEAYNTLIKNDGFLDMPDILLGAEIALERNLYKLDGIEKLAVEEMNTLLIELPYEKYKRWMREEIEEISYKTKMQIIIAHLDRYIDIFGESDYEDILGIDDAIFQLNVSSLKKWKAHRLIRRLIKDEYPIVFGTDCHDLNKRRPDFDVLGKSLKKYVPHIKTQQLFNR